MKVYFNATITSDPNLRGMYKNIRDILTKEGHQILEYGPDAYNNPEELAQRSDDEIKDSYNQLNKYLKSCDVLIAEISQPSSGLGYEISQAVTLKKPVLILKYDKAQFEPLSTIQGSKSNFIKYKTYNERTLEGLVKSFLSDAKDLVDTKFILIIPPEIDRYLEWNARERGKAKAEVTREAIERSMNEDEKYQEHLQGNTIG